VAAGRGIALKALVAVVMTKIIAGVPGALVALPPQYVSHPAPRVVFLAMVLAFAGPAAFLILAGREKRARDLGFFFLLAASSFTDRLLADLAIALPSLRAPLRMLAFTPADAFVPYFVWSFFAAFPRVTEVRRSAFAARAIDASAIGGAFLFFGSVIAHIAGVWLGDPAALSPLPSIVSHTVRWSLLFLLTAPALPFALWRMRRTDRAERRRVGVLTAGVIIGLGPLSLLTIAQSISPPVDTFVRNHFWVVAIVGYPALVAIPLVTAYAVIARHALDVRLVIRRAVQYGLARQTLIAASFVPFAGLAAVVYLNRDATIRELAAGRAAVSLSIALGLAMLGVGIRKQLLVSIDRRFFREQYDSRRILLDVIEAAHETRSAGQLARRALRSIDSALHVQCAYMLLVDPPRFLAASPLNDVRPIPLDSVLLKHVGDRGVLRLDPEKPPRDLPEDDLHWAVDTGARLFLAIETASSGFVGVLAIGEKRSELPFTSEDTTLLKGVAAALSNSLELTDNPLQFTSVDSVSPGHLDQGDNPARECLGCGVVLPSDAVNCDCGTPTREAYVPLILNRKFRLERRIGAGGAGVVYRAEDLVLRRPVALKALPQLSASAAARLRREARTMAAVHHDNLAFVYGAETWHGRPLVVVEYLAGGVLSDRLNAQRFTEAQAVALGLQLASVLECIHDAGILHRDVKPSNIGFTSDGKPKLLDFGLAQLTTLSSPASLGDKEQFAKAGVATVGAEVPFNSTNVSTTRPSAEHAGGTLYYMSPEAINGERPAEQWDVWALCIVLYECVTGSHPLVGLGAVNAWARLALGEIPDIRTRSECSSAIGRFFDAELGQDRSRRSRNGRELRERLASIDIAASVDPLVSLQNE
jgi:hypothetical protein